MLPLILEIRSLGNEDTLHLTAPERKYNLVADVNVRFVISYFRRNNAVIALLSENKSVHLMSTLRLLSHSAKSMFSSMSASEYIDVTVRLTPG